MANSLRNMKKWITGTMIALSACTMQTAGCVDSIAGVYGGPLGGLADRKAIVQDTLKEVAIVRASVEAFSGSAMSVDRDVDEWMN